MNAPEVLHPALTELTIGARETAAFVVTAADMQRFAELSGDWNPLHMDDDFARAKGFEGRVVYGGLLVAKVSQLIGMRLPGRDAVWASLRLDFVKPLYVGQPAVVEGALDEVSRSTGMLVLKLRICNAANQTLARGKAEVLLVR